MQDLPLIPVLIDIRSQVSDNRGAETFEEVFGIFGEVGRHFLCEVFGQFIKGSSSSWGAA